MPIHPVRSARRLRAAVPLLLALLVAPSPGGASAPLPRLAGLSLAEAIERLHGVGLEVTFSEALVTPDLEVVAEPASTEPAAALAEILAPHALALQTGPGGRLVIVRAEPAPLPAIRGMVRDSREGSPLAGVLVWIAGRPDLADRTDAAGRFEIGALKPGAYALIAESAGFTPVRLEGVRAAGPGGEVEIELALALTSVDEIVVTPSLISVARDEPVARLSLTTEELRRLPVAGDDPMRAARRLPGTTGGDYTARLNVRGGHADELLVLLDGVELFEPFHLPEFQSALSIVPPETVGRLDLITGGFPATYGDRMSGVLDMTSVEPTARRGQLGLGVLDAQAGSSGTFKRSAGSWLASGRLSMLPYAARIAEREEDPAYYDLFAKVGYQLSPHHSLRAQWLLAEDDVRFETESESAVQRVDANYRSVYGWLSHEATVRNMLLESIASVGRIDRDRNGSRLEAVRTYEVRDPRELEFVGLRHKGLLQLSPRHSLKWGGSVRDQEAHYGYFSKVQFSEPVEDEEIVSFDGVFEGRQTALFVSDRFRLFDDLTFELGVRWDESEIVEQSHASPRASLAWAVGRRNIVRLAWGYYYQSQRAYELQVADGETRFSRDERAEQSILSFEHLFDRGIDVRVEGYSRRVARPRARWENLLDPVSSFPEVENDRVRIAPERAWARGLELLLRRRGGRVDLWTSYAYAEIDDRIDGRGVPRAVDQKHTFNGSVSVRLGEAWDLAAGWNYHSGWPTTAVLGSEIDEDGDQLLPVFGPIRAERLASYSRLDLRAARRWSLFGGELTAYADLHNVLNRTNPRGVELVLDLGELGGEDEETGVLPRLEDKSWLGRVMTAGVRWRF